VPSLLIFEPSWQRIRGDLAALPSHDIILFGVDGNVRDGKGITLPHSDIAPNAAWLNTDVWQSDKFAAFADIMLQAPALAWVQSAAAGTEFPIIQSILAKNSRLCTSHVQASAIAESVIGRLLANFQHENQRASAQASRRWQALPFRELDGSKWLIVGFGAIGQAIAERVRPFGASIVGVRRTESVHVLADRMVSPREIAGELPEADIVVLSLPLDANTQLFDAKMLACMKSESVLINVARGPIVDTEALLKALDEERIGAAILDVFDREPLPEDSPLWYHPRVMLSAHSAALGHGLAARGDALFIYNFDRFLRGEVMRWEVQLARSGHQGKIGQLINDRDKIS
jgi:phosphoglycerate dehydrogenase-like enzyme